MIAPAARNFAAMAESRGTFAPSSDQEPAGYISSEQNATRRRHGLLTGRVHFVKCSDIVFYQYWNAMERAKILDLLSGSMRVWVRTRVLCH